jgi:hypothetical protein
MNLKLFPGLLCLMLCSIPRAQATFSVSSRHWSSLDNFAAVAPVTTIDRHPDQGFQEIRHGQLTEESTILSLRGGGGVFSSFESYVTASKTRCWGVLLVSIVTDTVSTTMIKVARDEKSMIKLAGAFGGYFLRWERLALFLVRLTASLHYTRLLSVLFHQFIRFHSFLGASWRQHSLCGKCLVYSRVKVYTKLSGLTFVLFLGVGCTWNRSRLGSWHRIIRRKLRCSEIDEFADDRIRCRGIEF